VLDHLAPLAWCVEVPVASTSLSTVAEPFAAVYPDSPISRAFIVELSGAVHIPIVAMLAAGSCECADCPSRSAGQKSRNRQSRGGGMARPADSDIGNRRRRGVAGPGCACARKSLKGVSKEAEQALDSLIRRIDTVLMSGGVATSYQFAAELLGAREADTVPSSRGSRTPPPPHSRGTAARRRQNPLGRGASDHWLALERTRSAADGCLQGVPPGRHPPASRERLRSPRRAFGNDPICRSGDGGVPAARPSSPAAETWQDEARTICGRRGRLVAADAADPRRELGNLAEAAAPDVGRRSAWLRSLRARIAARPSAEASPAAQCSQSARPCRKRTALAIAARPRQRSLGHR